jgi:hypothetical protein
MSDMYSNKFVLLIPLIKRQVCVVLVTGPLKTDFKAQRPIRKGKGHFNAF